MKSILVALSVALLPSIAIAQAEPAPSTDAGGGAQAREDSQARPAEEAEREQRQICRRIQHSYSHRTQRVCMTAEQWRQQQNRR